MSSAVLMVNTRWCNDHQILFSLDTNEEIDANLIVINNAPIGPYHVLLVPRRELEQPQIITVDSLIFAFRFVTASANPYIYIGFNSLCGYASMNHVNIRITAHPISSSLSIQLHFHGVYFPGPSYLQRAVICSSLPPDFSLIGTIRS